MTREQEIQELDIGLARDAISRLGAMLDMSCKAEASGIQSALTSLKEAQVRVVALQQCVNLQRMDIDELKAQLTAAQATNAQRDARLVRAGMEAATDAASEYVLRIGSYGCEDLASDLRALATDETAIANILARAKESGNVG